MPIRVVQVPEANADFELVERETPEPGRGQVRVKVQACGVCHSDAFTKTGGYPGVEFPRVPGHEVAGLVDALGEGTEDWGYSVGDRVGVGWFGGHCHHCEPCRRGDFIRCVNGQISGISYDGGYADAMVAPVEALARIPDDLAAEDAAPLLCAGITTYNALRHSGAHGGDVVAILGVGGLGHLGVQFARNLGFHTVAIARGTEKEKLARELGAREYIDSTAGDPGAALAELGGAKVILATVASADAMTAVVHGLAPRGTMVIVGASMDPIQVPPAMLIGGSTGIRGHASGTSRDSEDTLDFSALTGVRPRIETMPLEDAAKAYEKMMAGDARFRMVLTT
jgi:D-arabinose 1-dehydrogenase-like Zn-dependent alcohol dehydrogenase